MQKFHQHILHQINLELNVASEQTAFDLKNGLDRFFKDEFLPQAELLFEEIIPSGQIIRYDSLDLEINLDANESLQFANDSLINQLRTKLDLNIPNFSFQLPRPGISNTQQNATSGAISENQSNQPLLAEPISDEENTLLYFLKTGQLPWHANSLEYASPAEDAALSTLIQNKVFLQKLKLLFQSDVTILERFVQQISPSITMEVIGHFSGAPEKSLRKLKAGLGTYPESDQIKICKLLIKILITHRQLSSEIVKNEILNDSGQLNSISGLEKLLMEFFASAGLKYETDSPSGQIRPEIKKHLDGQASFRTNSQQEKNDLSPIPEFSERSVIGSLYIQNAGIILAHPFLSKLFAVTGCLNNRNHIIPDKKQKVVQLIHYLATGLGNDFEFNLTFEKYLCGLPQETILSRISELSEEDRNECTDLLKSIVSYWPALKNTSPYGLRQMFFHRNGKLDLTKSPHKLYIERKAQDVLLDKLQWNISIVKLPWMDDLLFVEW